jgi:Putative beta-lactamase-inhibitor-like, PepSY-like
MKPNILQYTVIAFVSISITSISIAQEKKMDKKDLPKAIVESFQKSYPKAEIKGASIEKEKGKTYYEIESLDGKQKRDLLYTKNGNIAEIEETLNTNEIPDFVNNSIMKKYPDGKIHKAEKLTTGEKISYEVIVQYSGSKSEVVLDSTGNIKKAKQKKSGEKEEKDND